MIGQRRARAGQAAASDQYIQELRGKLRIAMGKADEGDRRWRERRTYLDDYMIKNAHNFKTDGLRRDKIANDWQLNDAEAYWRHWQMEVIRYSSAITAEVAAATALAEIGWVEEDRGMGTASKEMAWVSNA